MTKSPALDPKQMRVTQQWKYTSPLIACRYRNEDQFLFTSAEDSTVQRWDIDTGEFVVLEGHDSWVRDMQVVHNGQTLVTVGSDQKMICWPAVDKEPVPVRQVVAHDGWVRSISASADGQWMATGGNDGLVKLWDVESFRAVAELAGHGSHVYSTMFVPGDEYLLSGDLQGNVNQWEIGSGKLVRTLKAGTLHTYSTGQRVHYGGVRSLTMSPDGKYLACSGLHKATNPLGAVNEPIVVLFDWESGKQLKSFVCDSSIKGIAWKSIFIGPTQMVGLAGGRSGGHLLFWDTAKEMAIQTLNLKNTARGMDLDPHGLRLATTHHDGSVRISRMSSSDA